MYAKHKKDMGLEENDNTKDATRDNNKTKAQDTPVDIRPAQTNTHATTISVI